MASTTTMLWFIDSADPIADIRHGLVNDPRQATALAEQLIPDTDVVLSGEATLADTADCGKDQLLAGVFGRLAVLCGPSLTTNRPSELTDIAARIRPSRMAAYLCVSSADSTGAFARWDNAELRRSFSANPFEIYEDIGLPFIFEGSFWGGEHPVPYPHGVAPDPQALPFLPHEFAEHAIGQWLGLGFNAPDTDDPAIALSSIPLSVLSIQSSGQHVGESWVADRDSRAVEYSDEQEPAAPKKIARWFGFGGSRKTAK